MPKQDPTAARQQTHELLQGLHAALGQAPLHAWTRSAILAVLDVLGELDLERRFQVRERIAELLTHEGGERP